MKKTFLYYCNQYAWRRDTTDMYDTEKQQEFLIKATDPEWKTDMDRLSSKLDENQSVFVIRDNAFEHAIQEAYIKPAIREHEKQYQGKIILNGHVYLLVYLVTAFACLGYGAYLAKMVLGQ
jgi:hypothetical protein